MIQLNQEIFELIISNAIVEGQRMYLKQASLETPLTPEESKQAISTKAKQIVQDYLKTK